MAVLDSHGNIVRDVSARLQLTLVGTSDDGFPAALEADPAADAVRGVATFAALAVREAGRSYALRAVDGTGLLSAVSALFDVLPGIPASLVVLTQPRWPSLLLYSHAPV